MVKWGMHEDEINICMVEVKQRQALKERGKLARDAPLCTRPAYRIYRREFNSPILSVGVEDLIDDLFFLLLEV